MNIGVSIPLPAYSVDVALMANKAEQLGFESIWCAEHPIMPVHTTSPFSGSADGVIPETYAHFVDPFIALARASGATSTIKLGTSIVLVPERNPLLMAKEISCLDYFSGGRFIFGIGAGWLREETEIMGGDFDHRWTQTREAVLAMKELWTKDEAEFHGRYYDFPLVKSYPKPVQKPHPPVVLGGSAKNVLRRVAGWGDGLAAYPYCTGPGGGEQADARFLMRRVWPRPSVCDHICVRPGCRPRPRPIFSRCRRQSRRNKPGDSVDRCVHGYGAGAYSRGRIRVGPPWCPSQARGASSGIWVGSPSLSSRMCSGPNSTGTIVPRPTTASVELWDLD